MQDSHRPIRWPAREPRDRDVLTGLLNYRYARAAIAQLLALVRGGGGGFALIHADLDGTAHLNLEPGHLVADEVIAAAGKIIVSIAGPGSRVCRVGGDKFLVLVPDASLASALEVAENIRRGVEHEIQGVVPRPLPPITVTLGVARHPDHGHDSDTLMAAAKEACFKGKDAGRNRVELA
jgi:diguanylate cyclase (GGDEF)-like protein